MSSRRSSAGTSEGGDGIPTRQLERWTNSGARTQPRRAQQRIKWHLGVNRSPVSDRMDEVDIFIQGSHKNDTITYGGGDVDAVVKLESAYYSGFERDVPDWQVDLYEQQHSPADYTDRDLRDDILRALGIADIRYDDGQKAIQIDDDRLGRSFADLAGFVEDLREKGVDIDLVNQPIGTVGEDDWMAEMMLNMMMVFADAERKMIRSRVQEGIDAAIADGKRVGRPPFGYTVEGGFLQQIPAEYVRAQTFIREVRKGREKHATAAYFEIPESAIQSILARAEANYDIPFDNDQWRLERAKVDTGEKQLVPLEVRDAGRAVSATNPTE